MLLSALAFRLVSLAMRALTLVLVLGLSLRQAGAQGSGYWHTSGNRLLDSNDQAVRIAGINWYGFETADAVVHGLTTQDYKVVLQTVKVQGYNTVRIPFSNQMIETPSASLNVGYWYNFGPINTDLQGLNSLEVLDKIVSYAGTIGLKIILDNHRSEAGNTAEANGLWYTSSYPESSWIADWQALAERYRGNSTVIGFDLRNEPHNAASGGACWDCGSPNDWHLAAARAGNAALAINPNLLIFVEGTDTYNNDFYWWGGNLAGVARSPVSLAIPNRLVYSAHDYGPGEYRQTWFNGSTSPESLQAVWTAHWAFISQQNIAPVWLGEFGTRNADAGTAGSTPGSQGQWFQTLTAFLFAHPALNWTYWALNGEDCYGLLDTRYDATPVNALKQAALATIQFPLSPGSASAISAPAAPAALNARAASSREINLTWTARNGTASAPPGVTYTVFFGTSAGSIGTVLASGLPAASFQATGLNSSTTYFFRVTASSASGTSPVSNAASATTLAPPVLAAPVRLRASPGSASQIDPSWNSTYTQSGRTVSISNAAWNGSILPGGNVSGIGWNANYSGPNSVPTQFSVNGLPCR